MRHLYKLLFISLITLITSLSCTENKTCEGSFFGRPVSNTGLSFDKCKPTCECKEFVSKDFTSSDFSILRSYTLSQEIAEIVENPYDDVLIEKPEGVCAVVIEDIATKTYHLENFESTEAAESAGAIVTHYDACGACSTLEDFVVYAENLDVGRDVRICAILNLDAPIDTVINCIQEIGFTKPCAQIWAYNTINTRTHCFDVCISDDTYNKEDGTLSNCLQCDETYSGSVFKNQAGRTRRNTGIASSICRFCEEVEIVEHNYPL